MDGFDSAIRLPLHRAQLHRCANQLRTSALLLPPSACDERPLAKTGSDKRKAQTCLAFFHRRCRVGAGQHHADDAVHQHSGPTDLIDRVLGPAARSDPSGVGDLLGFELDVDSDRLPAGVIPPQGNGTTACTFNFPSVCLSRACLGKALLSILRVSHNILDLGLECILYNILYSIYNILHLIYTRSRMHIYAISIEKVRKTETQTHKRAPQCWLLLLLASAACGASRLDGRCVHLGRNAAAQF